MNYLKKGEYKEAVEHILNVLGTGECPVNTCQGCKVEMEEARDTAKAVLGLPVPRQKCKYCGALDQIWATRNSPFICHNCNNIINEEDSEFVEEPVE